MATRRKGVFYLDRIFPVVGRVNRSLMTRDKKTADYREQVVERLCESGRYEVVRGWTDGNYGIAELCYAFEQGPSAVRELREWSGNPLVTEVLADYTRKRGAEIKTASRYAASIKAVLKYAGSIRMKDLASADFVNDFKAYRLSRGISTDTVHRDLAAISQILQHHGGRGLARRVFDDVRWPRVAARRTRRLKPDEIQRLLLAAAEENPRYAMIYRIMLSTGLRPSEMLRVSRDGVLIDEKVLRVRDSKTPKGVRSVPLTDDALRTILLHFPDGTGVNKRQLEEAFRRHANRAGLEDVKLRDLRRTHAQYCRLVEGDVVKARDQLGHTTVVHTEAYTGEASAEERRTMVENAIKMMQL